MPEQMTSPTRVGMNRIASRVLALLNNTSPTRVGMNRYACAAHHLRDHQPHACGDEPNVWEYICEKG